MWRGWIIGGVIGFVIGGVIGFVAPAFVSQPEFQVVIYSVMVPLGIFVFSPWIVRMMMRKKFKGFRLEMRSDSD